MLTLGHDRSLNLITKILEGFSLIRRDPPSSIKFHAIHLVLPNLKLGQEIPNYLYFILYLFFLFLIKLTDLESDLWNAPNIKPQRWPSTWTVNQAQSDYRGPSNGPTFLPC